MPRRNETARARFFSLFRDSVILMVIATLMYPEIGATQSLYTSTPVGRWKTVDDVTGKINSVVNIWEQDGTLYGQIEKLIDPDPNDPDPRSVRCSDDLKNQRLIGLGIDIAWLLLREYSADSAPARRVSIGGLTRNTSQRVIEYAEANLSRPVTVRDLAVVAELSPYHFVRMFKKALGLTPHQYLLERRVERAKELIRAGPASLAEVSLSTGFDSQSHFTSAFHRAVGATPAEFRRLVAGTT